MQHVAVLALGAAAAVAVVGASSSAATASPAGSPPPPPPSPLEQKYAALQNATCGHVLPNIPALPAADAASFLAAYQQFKGETDEKPLMDQASALLSAPAVQAFLSLPDSFVVPGGLDAAMVLCAVLVEATPAGLAAFAGQSPMQEALVGSLLNNSLLMRDMLLAGGASAGLYGNAMQILAAIVGASPILSAAAPWSLGGRGGGGTGAKNAAAAADNAADDPVPWDDRSQNVTAILRRLALGIAVEQAEPIQLAWGKNHSAVDPVQRYLHYEAAYLNGDLDSSVEVLTAFEFRHTTDGDSTDADVQWMRETMAIYRPDNIARDMSWRYAESVHTDVSYGDPQCSDMPGICTGRYAQIPAAGGECGPRAFFGRFARKAFGVPTWGVTQPGHAAMTTWTLGGWHVLLGAGWEYSWWGERGGMDFLLETQARELQASFQENLRGTWAARARGDKPAGTSWSTRTHSGYGEGGLWSALMLYVRCCVAFVVVRWPLFSSFDVRVTLRA
jgi:hypothetical protein